MIFDNVDAKTLKRMKEVLPQKGQAGRLLFTTCEAGVANELAKARNAKYESFELQPMPNEDAATLFIQGTGEALGRSDVKDVVDFVKGLPWTIQQAAAFMKESRYNIEQLLESFQTDEADEILG